MDKDILRITERDYRIMIEILKEELRKSETITGGGGIYLKPPKMQEQDGNHERLVRRVHR